MIFLDITASSEKRTTTLKIVSEVAEQCFMPLCVGGGVRGVGDFTTLLHAGADKVSVNTGAVENPDLISSAARHFGNQCVVLSVDVRRVGGRYEVFTYAGRTPTGLDPVEWAQQAVALGAGEILLTSIDREGTLEGYDLELTRAVVEAVPVPVIAHGGCGNLEHLVEVVTAGGADAAACASMLHFTDQSVIKGRAHMKTYGVDVRVA